MQEKLKKNAFIISIDLILFVLVIFNFYSIIHKAQLPEASVKSANSSTKGLLLQHDKLISIEGIELNDNIDSELILDRFAAGDTVNIIVERNNEKLELKIITTAYYDLIYLITLGLCGFSFLFSAFFILLKLDDLQVARIFHSLLFSIFIMLFFTWGSLKVLPSYINITIRSIYDLSYFIVPATAIHFSFMFPKIKWQGANRFFKAIYIFFTLTLVPIVYINYPYIFGSGTDGMQLYYWVRGHILDPFILPLFVLMLINYFHSYFGSDDDNDRSKLLWIFLGLIPGPALYVFLYRITEIIFGQTMMSETVMIAFLAWMPISLMIAIIRFNFFDIRLIYRRSVVYAIVLVILTALYIGIIYLLTHIMRENFSSYIGIPGAVAALVNILLFNPLKKRVQKFIDRKFFLIKYDYKKIELKFFREIKNCFTGYDINDLIKDTLNESIPVSNFYFLVYSPDNDDLYYIEDYHEAPGQNTLYTLKEICKGNKEKLPLAKKNSVEPDIKHISDENLLEQLNCDLALMSYNEDFTLINVLCFGAKKSGFKFRQEDIDLLLFCTIESGNALQRIDLQRKILFHKEETGKLKELNELKSFFVSSVSHELKTPLTSIRMFAELLSTRDDIPEDKKQEYLGIIQGESDRLNRLVNNILDFSKIERGSKDYIFESCDLNEITASVLQTMEYRLKLLKFDTDIILYEGPMPIKADRDSISEVFINLISNSIKYSDTVKFISIKTYATDEFHCFEISDKGIGISKEELENIFTPYYRSKSSQVKNTKGTGIGLSLVKNIMSAHNGKIKVESELATGTRFVLQFPKEI